jgi:hypothetical protein
MNSKTKISQRHVLTVGIKTYFLALRLSRFVMGKLSAIERMELDEEELREFGLDEEAESEE